MISLENIDRLMIQFIVNNEKAVPLAVRRFRRFQEPPRKEDLEEKPPVLGQIDRIEGEFVASDLILAGYELVSVDTFSRSRPSGFGRYQVIRFNFAREGQVQVPKGFLRNRDGCYDAIYELLRKSAWSVRVYINPEESPWVSINFACRVPIRNADDSLILQYEKDEAGHKVGDAPTVPVVTNGSLRAWGGLIHHIIPETALV